MGGGNSSQRTVTIEEDNSPGTVKVSESVARRLLGHPELPESGESSQQGQQPSDEELLKLTKYYQNKLRKLEKKNQDLYHNSVAQFAKAVDEVEQKFLNTTASPVCEDLQFAALHCYQRHPKQTLNCSKEVLLFKDCVEKQREKLLIPGDKKNP